MLRIMLTHPAGCATLLHGLHVNLGSGNPIVPRAQSLRWHRSNSKQIGAKASAGVEPPHHRAQLRPVHPVHLVQLVRVGRALHPRQLVDFVDSDGER